MQPTRLTPVVAIVLIWRLHSRPHATFVPILGGAASCEFACSARLAYSAARPPQWDDRPNAAGMVSLAGLIMTIHNQRTGFKTRPVKRGPDVRSEIRDCDSERRPDWQDRLIRRRCYGPRRCFERQRKPKMTEVQKFRMSLRSSGLRLLRSWCIRPGRPDKRSCSWPKWQLGCDC
jgi:hypothetical protein